mmetsp:Transcript_8340/g.25906  ORF Transcript_8340/g.25906 Transcript_8340/m.25906 type:complete len:244 (+) Transcript_8340:69-800(+)|eukprot:scaffold49782_cov24-Tisochrysis_lutea.AAC.2
MDASPRPLPGPNLGAGAGAGAAGAIDGVLSMEKSFSALSSIASALGGPASAGTLEAGESAESKSPKSAPRLLTPPAAAITAPPPEPNMPKRSSVPAIAPGGGALGSAVALAAGVSRSPNRSSVVDTAGAGGAASPAGAAGVGSLSKLTVLELDRLRSLPSRLRLTLMEPMLAERPLAPEAGAGVEGAGAGLATSKRSSTGGGAGAGDSNAASKSASGAFQRSVLAGSLAPLVLRRGAVSAEKP